jgi:hypothetical protein
MAVTQLNTAQVKDGSINRDDLDITTPTKAVVRKIIAGTNITISETGVDAGTGDVTINASVTGGSLTLTTVEVDLGSSPRRSGSFSITSSGLITNKAVSIQQAVGPYTGKGTLPDETEMDMLIVTGITTSATNIQCYWNCPTFVKGNFKFNYIISA